MNKPYRIEKGTYSDIEVLFRVVVGNGWICNVQHGATPEEYLLVIWGKCA